MFPKPGHDVNPLMLAVIYFKMTFFIEEGYHRNDAAHVRYKCSILNHQSSNHQLIQINSHQKNVKIFHRFSTSHHHPQIPVKSF